MNGVRRKVLVVGIDLLLLGVALPFLIALQAELEHLEERLHAERSVRSAAVEAAQGEPPDEPTPPVRPERAVVRPDAAAPSAGPAEAAEDPFLAEARRRAAEDPEAAMAWIQAEATGRRRLQAMLEAVAVWAGEEPESALLWLESNAGGLARIETISTGVEFWSREDPESAADWIAGMANDGSKATAAKTLARNWAERAPEEASAWVNRLAPGPVRNEAAAALVVSWAESDPEAASIWALKESEFTGENELLMSSLRQYAALQPEAAAGFVRELRAVRDPSKDPFVSSGEPEELVESYVRGRVEADPVAAARWFDRLPAGDPLADDSSARALAAEWSRTDSVAASAWIAEQAAGPRRDAAILGFAESVAEFEPEAAAAWSNTISNPAKRMETLTATVESWARRRPKEALDWVTNAELEPDFRESLADRIGAD